MTEEALFEFEVPIRKGTVGYLTSLSDLTHASVWALAPVDRSLRPRGKDAVHDTEVEHVWLIVPGDPPGLAEAVIRLTDGEVLARREPVKTASS